MLPDRMMLKTINIREGTGMQEMILSNAVYAVSDRAGKHKLSIKPWALWWKPA